MARSALGSVNEDALRVTRTWQPLEAAEYFDARVRSIESEQRRTYVEYGLILCEMEHREYWRLLVNPVCRRCESRARMIDRDAQLGGSPSYAQLLAQGEHLPADFRVEWRHGVCPWCDSAQEYFSSLDRWLITAAPVSRTTGYASKKAVESCLAAGLSLEQLGRIPRANLETVARLSPAAQRDPQVLAAAENGSNQDLLEKLDEEYPEQHIEPKRKVFVRATRSARQVIDEGLEAVELLYGIEGREGAIEYIFAAWLDAPCEIEQFQNRSNREAAEELKRRA
jgi:hypothetical protein